MRTDPFLVKRMPRWRPQRLAFTAGARLEEWRARRRYRSYALPELTWADLPSAPEADWSATSVTPLQMSHLLRCLEMTAGLPGTTAVEVGAYRGETTRHLARAAGRPYVAVDPYSGYGGADEHLADFRRRTADAEDLTLLRFTSGEAARAWPFAPIGFLFIDAVHDYVNTAFDLEAWCPRVVTGGIVALHDTDQACFAGTRRAAYEAVGLLELLAHPPNLTILRKV